MTKDGTMKTIIKNGKVITPFRIRHVDVVIEEGKISELVSTACEERNDQVIDAKGRYVAPGFIDIHTHGAGGFDFMDGTKESYISAIKTQLTHGTTYLLPTMVTGTQKGMLDSIEAFREAKADELYGRMLHGLHLEGPYFSMNQRGAMDPAFIRNPEKEEYEQILKHKQFIKRWSFAPELPGAIEFCITLRKEGVIPSIAHSDAVYEQVIQAFECGQKLATHLYSGMSTIKRVQAYRYLGVIESALAIKEMDVELIADGKHLPSELIKMVYDIKGSEHIALVTDSIRASGTDVKESIIGGRTDGLRVLIEDEVAKLPDRSAFAGSVATTDRLLRVAYKEANIPLIDAVQMLTSTPARILGVENQKGILAQGKDADIVLFDEDVNVSMVILGGRIVSRSGSAGN